MTGVDAAQPICTTGDVCRCALSDLSGTLVHCSSMGVLEPLLHRSRRACVILQVQAPGLQAIATGTTPPGAPSSPGQRFGAVKKAPLKYHAASGEMHPLRAAEE